MSIDIIRQLGLKLRLLVPYLWILLSESDLGICRARESAYLRRGRTDNLCQAAELSNISPISPISRSGSSLIFLQHVQTWTIEPAFVYRPLFPRPCSTPFYIAASCRLNISLHYSKRVSGFVKTVKRVSLQRIQPRLDRQAFTVSLLLGFSSAYL